MDMIVEMIGSLIYGIITEFFGSGTRFLIFKLLGRKHSWSYYLSDEYNAVNTLVGTIVLLMLGAVTLLLIFML